MPSFDPATLGALFAIGLFAGTLGGLLGIGGGLVMIPALILLLGEQRFGVDTLHTYKLAALATAVALSIPAVVRHAKTGAIAPRIVRRMVVGTLAGVLLGAAFATLFVGDDTQLLRRGFGGFMLFAVTVQVLRASRSTSLTSNSSCPTSSRWLPWALAVGAPAGALAGLLGVGGGVWSVPTQSMVFRVNARTAIANSSCAIIAAAAAGALVQTLFNLRLTEQHAGVGWGLAFTMLPGALLGGWIGAHLTERLPVATLRAIFQVVLVVTGLRLLVGG